MDTYVLRPATEADFPSLARLWEEVFGDGPEFTSEFFRLLWTPGCCRAAFAHGDIAAMGFCLRGPTARGAHCGYIYAMATQEAHRGRGLAAAVGRALLADAFGTGLDLVATLPAEESLNAWYESRLGMSPCFMKGGEGVSFPQSWLDFADFCGGHDPRTPQTLLAAAAPGFDLSPLLGLGWECCFD